MSSLRLEKKKPVIDITRTLHAGIATWPGAAPFAMTPKFSHSKDGFQDSDIKMNIHTGTHIDAPLHFFHQGEPANQTDLSKMMGPCQIIEYQGQDKHISLDFVRENYQCKLAPRVMFKTRNSFSDPRCFDQDFVSLSEESAGYLASLGVNLVGVDGPSVQAFDAKSNLTHTYLLEKQVVILEGVDLSQVKPGVYECVVLPLKIEASEGAPARAILLEYGDHLAD